MRSSSSPLSSEKEISALKGVCQAVVVEPGDVYVFSGAGAHMACGMGDVLNLAAYEAILGFHKDNLELFRKSNSMSHHYDCRSTRDDLDDWNEVRNLEHLEHLEHLEILNILKILILTCLDTILYYQVHMNGHMQDVYARLHGTEFCFFVPIDGEVSWKEVQYECRRAP